MLRNTDAIDAKIPFSVKIKKLHCCRAIAKNAFHCVEVNALMDLPEVVDAQIHRGIAVIWFKNQKRPTRYQLSRRAYELLKVNDLIGSKAAVWKWVQDNGDVITFDPPRRAIQLEYLRSPTMKLKRKESVERRRGQPKRPHRTPKPTGLRNGQGVAHTWKKDPSK